MADVEARLGQRVAFLRHEAGLTQAQVAERVGCTIETISRLERGQVIPSVARLAELAEALGVELTDLFNQPRGARQKAEDRLGAVLRRATAEEIEMVADVAERILGRGKGSTRD